MMIDCKYGPGDILYLKTDPEQRARVVVEVRYSTGIKYILALGTIVSEHNEFEVSEEENVLLKTA